MDSRFQNIKVIGWDLDTTLYKNIPELSVRFRDGCIEEVARVKKLPFEEAKKVFYAERIKSDSSTQALINLKVGDFWTCWEIQKRIGKKNYIKKDPKLTEIFNKLKGFRHFIISNSVDEEIHTVLESLGLSVKYFEGLIGSEKVGKVKPDPAPFQLLLKTTGLPPEQHVYVGDREKVDIEPAKKLGMKTILVWGESEIADLSLPTVYDIVKVLI